MFFYLWNPEKYSFFEAVIFFLYPHYIESLWSSQREDVGDKVDVKYDTAKTVYDPETARWIFKDSPLFENVEIEDINPDENDQFPLYIDFGTAHQDEERYDFIKLSQVKKIYR